MLWFCSRTPRACKRFHLEVFGNFWIKGHIGSLWITGWFHLNKHSCKWLVWVKIRIPGRPQNWSYLVLESPFWVQRIYWYNLTVTQLHPQKLPACANEKVVACEDDWFFPSCVFRGQAVQFQLKYPNRFILTSNTSRWKTPGCPPQQELRALDPHQPPGDQVFASFPKRFLEIPPVLRGGLEYIPGESWIFWSEMDIGNLPSVRKLCSHRHTKSFKNPGRKYSQASDKKGAPPKKN